MKEEDYRKLMDEIALLKTYLTRAEEYAFLAQGRLSVLENELIDISYGENN